MLPFRTPTPEDRQWILPKLNSAQIPLCEYSFPVLFCWRNAFKQKICLLKERLLTRLDSNIGGSYLWPVGTGALEPAFAALTEDARARQTTLRLVCLTQTHCQLLERLFPGRFSYSETCSGPDYLYDIQKMVDLSGKKLHAKRNHIRRFEDVCPNWTFHRMTEKDIPDCLALDEIWAEASGKSTQERAALWDALTLQTKLGLDGGIIRDGTGTLCAYTLGAALTQTIYDVHFERARPDLQGAYALINREFARFVKARYPNISLLNREDDMGLPGLRQAKLSYHPLRLERKYCAAETPCTRKN
ncbi:MAG: phosphatidylglycerol lysyltransferase domain-containing protein [Evtepia sp.]